ncbi:MAG: RDD family protein [Moraxellaceae bacterium]|nr:RDD family protein [Moraxellaceae bacterium]
MYLDTRHAVATPEGVDLELPLAGAVPRATAWLIDFMIRAALLLAAGIALAVTGRFGNGLMMLIAFLVEWFYPVLFELMRGGATPGKKSVGLCVVESDGRPVGFSASIIRNLLRVADFLPFMFGFGILFMLFHPRFQRLGDLAAGTLVVWAPVKTTVPVLPLAPVVAPPLPLRLAEQKAVIAFAERSARLSEARQQELADLLQTLTQRQGAAGVTRLQGMARWLAGER